MTADLHSSRGEVLDAIDRRREELQIGLPVREDLDGASPASLRAVASSIRAEAWADRSVSAEELAKFGDDLRDDPGWAPSSASRVAALLDHLAELVYPTGGEVPLKPLPRTPPRPVPTPMSTPWGAMEVDHLAERLAALEGVNDVWVFDLKSEMPLLRACNWRGEIVEIVWLTESTAKIEELKAKLRSDSQDKSAKADVKADLERFRGLGVQWADALVRAGFLRAHFGPVLTQELFSRYVIGKERLDVTVDVNAITNGLVHHLARLAPHVDFARSAVTDLEIQRLADNPAKRAVWRQACRALEKLPVVGPAWRLLGMPDTTALLLARAEQGGEKSPGADALMAHNFEENLVRSHGVRAVLLSSDGGVARTLAARLRDGTVWAGYVDAPRAAERYLAPLISWTLPTASESRFSTLANLLDELLVCDVSNHLIATDGETTIELRSHLPQEHQYVSDWRHPYLFVRGFGAPRVRVPAGKWPLRVLTVPTAIVPSSARVTVEQVAISFEWLRSSDGSQVSREQLPIAGDAKKEAWNFLRSTGMIDAEGRVVGHAMLSNAALHRDTEALRELLLRFEPVAKIVRAVEGGIRTTSEARDACDMSDRTFSVALSLSVAGGLLWREGERIGSGMAFVPQEMIFSWLQTTARDAVRISELAQLAAEQLRISPVRFQEALSAVITDERLDGKRGGTAEPHPLDSKVIAIDDTGKIGITELGADNILGLRALQAR